MERQRFECAVLREITMHKSGSEYCSRFPVRKPRFENPLPTLRYCRTLMVKNRQTDSKSRFTIAYTTFIHRKKQRTKAEIPQSQGRFGMACIQDKGTVCMPSHIFTTSPEMITNASKPWNLLRGQIARRRFPGYTQQTKYPPPYTPHATLYKHSQASKSFLPISWCHFKLPSDYAP